MSEQLEDKVLNMIEFLIRKLKDEIAENVKSNIDVTKIFTVAYFKIVDENYDVYADLCREFKHDERPMCDDLLKWLIRETVYITIKVDAKIDKAKIRKLIDVCRDNKYCWLQAYPKVV